jgi:hypothetical protein
MKNSTRQWRAMPNRFLGKLKKNDEKLRPFETFNALYFDIQTASGSPLNIHSDHSLNVTFPI